MAGLTPATKQQFNALPKQELQSFIVAKEQFQIPKKYKFVRELGVGAYGIVCAVNDLESGKDVAIKRISKIFERKILAKRSLRELRLLRHFNQHENIISIADILLPTSEDFGEIYLVQELMEADMHQIIRSGQALTDAHFQYFMYQILRGLKYIHSANVLHRDLKPGNLLVNGDCELKIGDFGLARGYSEGPENSAGFMTEYVATRWYRAPEIMLSFLHYTKAIDIWSVGCIFAELLGSKPLFAGRDYVHQLNLILGVLGSPNEETLTRIGSRRAQEYIRSLPHMPKVPFTKLYPKATPDAIDLLEKLLAFDPSKRVTVEQALAHPYLATYHDAEDEPVCTNFDFSFEAVDRIDSLRNLVMEEILRYHPLKARRGTHAVVVPDLINRSSNEGDNNWNGGAASFAANEPNINSKDAEDLEKELSGATLK